MTSPLMALTPIFHYRYSDGLSPSLVDAAIADKPILDSTASNCTNGLSMIY